MQLALLAFRSGDDVSRLRNCESIAARVRLDRFFNSGSNGGKRFRRLASEQARGAHPRAQFRFKDEAAARYFPFDTMDFETHRRAIESGALERPSKFLRAFKQVIGRTRRKLD